MALPPTPNPRYELQTCLGAGGQGSTYRARDHERGEDVAIKVLELRRVDGWKPFDLFERECEVLRTLEHSGIPRYLDYFADEEAGRYFLVMELMGGESLDQLLTEGRSSSERELLHVLDEVLGILTYLHGRHPPVVHRDIKPDNLVRRDNGRIGLVDFGGVRVAMRPDGGSTMIGTFGYMAPEQLHGEASTATDIFSLGATLAALAAGRDAGQLERKGLKIDLARVLPATPLRALLAGMVEPDPEQRLKTVAAVRRRLGELTAPPEPGADARPAAAPPVEWEADDERRWQPPRIRVTGLISFVFWFSATITHLALYFVGSIILPLVFGALGRRKRLPHHKKKRLQRAERKAHRVVGETRQALRGVADRHDPDRRRMPRPPKPLKPPRPPAPFRRRGRRGPRRR